MNEMLVKILAAYASVGLHCTDPVLMHSPWMKSTGLYVRSAEDKNLIRFKNNPTSSLVVAHEVGHCALYEYRKEHGIPHPPSLDVGEEHRVIRMSIGIIERAAMSQGEPFVLEIEEPEAPK